MSNSTDVTTYHYCDMIVCLIFSWKEMFLKCYLLYIRIFFSSLHKNCEHNFFFLSMNYDTSVSYGTKLMTQSSKPWSTCNAIKQVKTINNCI